MSDLRIPAAATERTRELLDVMDLAHAERTLVVGYSTGMRKKIGLGTPSAAGVSAVTTVVTVGRTR